ncbi:MAG: M43 family zinc metalloprotease [Flavobacteriaceae bacterium]|jgi:hypothetical protein|nr:M43 family zinc metalloprotease [Flavobacteriaceae bacterium]
MKNKVLLAFLLLFSNVSLFGQENCGTPINSVPQHFEEEENNILARSSPTGICINVFFHIVRESNGTGGLNSSNINTIVNNLNEVFNPHRIFINNLGFDYIDNSTYYSFSDNKFNGLISINNNPNAINFYLVNSAPYAGRAEDILSRNLVVANNYALLPTSPHELGHCLNLWHTHHGRGCYDLGGCAENINGSNCSSCGDFVCDTPADPCLLGKVNSNCQYTGGGGFNPDVTNLMSYSGTCRTNFSDGQASRMRSAILNSPILQPVISNSCVIPELTGNDVICNNNEETFILENGGNNVTWNISSNLQIISSSNTSITVQPISSSINEIGFVEAILSYETLRKEFQIGVPASVNNAVITGESSICDFQQYTYTLSGLNHPCIDDIEWNVSPNLTIITQNLNSVTVVRNSSNTQHAGLISVNLPNGNIGVGKGVWIGLPNSNDLDIQKIGTYNFYVGQWTKLKAIYFPMIYEQNEDLDLTFEWQIPYSMVKNFPDTAYKDVKPNFAGQLNIGVRVLCDCGYSNWKYKLFDVVGDGNGGGSIIIPGD